MFDDRGREKVLCYVYALFDPRESIPALPFYIGKGSKNRVFDHASGAEEKTTEDDPLDLKLQLIKEIIASDEVVIHKILRFGLSNDEALNIEAALIDFVNYAHPGQLKNRISGQGTAEGFYDATELAIALNAEPLQENDQAFLLIKIENKWTDLIHRFGTTAQVPQDQIYDAARRAWRINTARANNADCVLVVARGIVRAAIVPTGWIDDGNEGRQAMTGNNELLANNYQNFIGRSVAHLFGKGSQNPIRYLRC